MKSLLIALPFLAFASAALAQEQDAFNVEPSIVHSEEGETTFGVAYDFDYSLFSKSPETTGPFDPTKPVSSFSISLEGAGLITASAEDNPRNFLETTFKAEGLYHSGGQLDDRRWIASGGLFGAYETDQSFDNQQVTLGAHATLATLGLKDDFAVEVRFGEVQPGEDVARKLALGITTLENYQRVSAEVNYQFQTGLDLVRDVELNYRWMEEIDAPPEIVAAELDQFDLFTVRVGLPGKLYVAYSEGKLPFDLEDERAFIAGFSYELGELVSLLQRPPSR